jgi:hypothetical protein
MDRPLTINPDLLLETLQIIIDRLLEHPDFCGSLPGRRLQDLRRCILRLLPPDEPPAPTRVELRPLVTSTVTLPADLDLALTVAAVQSGLSRSAMIESAVEMLVRRQ